MPLFEFSSDSLKEVETTSFASMKIRERGDLQRLIRDKIEALVPDTLVLAEEFGEWEESGRRIDILALDTDANLVVIELKRTDDGGHMELQAIRYAAMISAMTWDQAVEAHRTYLRKRGIEEDPQTRMLEFLEWDAPHSEQFAQDVRIILASADFSKEITTTVLWLREREIDIRCVRLKPYRLGDKTLMDVQQVIPLPEAEEYQIRLREKAIQERAARHVQGSREELNFQFWTQLLEKANSVLPLHRNASPTKINWLAASTHGCAYDYVLSSNTARVEFYISRDKALFDELHSKKDEIERAFGELLSWQRLDNRAACRIALNIENGSVNDQSTWDVLQDKMIDAMKRLESALKPHLDEYWSR